MHFTSKGSTLGFLTQPTLDLTPISHHHKETSFFNMLDDINDKTSFKYHYKETYNIEDHIW